uniref:Uncharacterized protein n=1 Tax=uncultured prokaryote TaxID=198431 RepID=A0A0H5Q5T5_9ZZZZ|nr:hypothetical protein [uncultured prokaryote]
MSVLSILIPDQCGLLTWNFSNRISGVTSDVAEFGCAFKILDISGEDPVTPMSESVMLEWCNAMALAAYDAWASEWTADYFPFTLFLDNVRCGFRGTDGLTVAEAYSPGSDVVWHGGTGYALPWQSALVISNYGYTPGAFDAGARRKRGRSYLPEFASTILSGVGDGALSPAQVTDMLNQWDQMWQAIRGADYDSVDMAGYLPLPGIVSPTDHAFWPTKYWRCDQIIDTQRRRRNREVSAYQSLEVLSST